MGNSLSAQLLKAGLVNKKQVGKAKQEQYQKTKKQQKGKKNKETPSDSKLLAKQAQEAEKERVRLLNRQRLEEGKQKEVMAQVGQMIEDAKIKITGELAYNFADGNKIKKIYITKEIRNQLGNGQLAIVKHKGQYQLTPAEVAKKIAARHKETVIVLNDPQQKAAEDDPYAEFPIPEDLEW